MTIRRTTYEASGAHAARSALPPQLTLVRSGSSHRRVTVPALVGLHLADDAERT